MVGTCELLDSCDGTREVTYYVGIIGPSEFKGDGLQSISLWLNLLSVRFIPVLFVLNVSFAVYVLDCWTCCG
jgi:hypothetical protein